MKYNLLHFCYGFLLVLISYVTSYAQLPANVLVGYHENWNTMKLSEIQKNYNVICLGFAIPVNAPQVGYDIRYTIPEGYSGNAVQKKAAFLADIEALHADGKIVLLSIGGPNVGIRLNTTAERDVFINSVDSILAYFDYKIDGIDLDLKSSSMNFNYNTWTISSPVPGQTNIVNAVKSIMENYKTVTGKKMILTAAPEAANLMGGLSFGQVRNMNGGAFLPILEGLKNEIDLLNIQLYNAGGTNVGINAWNNSIYYDNGTADFALAMNESVIKGFTCAAGKGTFTGFPSEKLAFGFPATSATSTAYTGYVNPIDICNAAKYFKGEIPKPSGISYTMSASYPDLKGLMAWSINEDAKSVNGAWNFADNFPCAFPETVTGLNSATENVFSVTVIPNPATTNSTITINLEKASEVSMNVTDITGTIVSTIAAGIMLESGKHSFKIPDSLPAGIYYVGLVVNGEMKYTSFVRMD